MDLQLPGQSVPITTSIVSSNPARRFLRVLRFSPPIKLIANDITEILLKVALNAIPPPCGVGHDMTQYDVEYRVQKKICHRET